MKKTVFITGSSSGIGKATAIHFAQQGWHVAATMRTPEMDNELKNISGVRLYKMDVTDAASIDSAITSVKTDFGEIDVVVNNAGYGVDGVFEAMSDEVIQKQFDTNVFGLMRVTRAFIPYMRQRKGGTIIQVSSMGGRLAFPLYSIYHASKWAVEGFTESLQFEVKPFGIRLKLVEPGAINTPFYGSSRQMIKPSDTKVYDEFVAKCEKLAMESGAKGEDPALVAATIYKAAISNDKKMRYPVGNPAPLLLALRKKLPDSWWFKVVSKSYKL